MLGLGLNGFNKQYHNDLAHLFSALTQAKGTLKIPQEYKGDTFDKFVAQLINYTLSGNYELNEPTPKSGINITHKIFTDFFTQNPQFVMSFLYVLDHKNTRLKKLLKDRYIGTNENRAVEGSLLNLTLIWSDTGRSIKDKNDSVRGKALFAKYVTGDGLSS